MINYIDKVSEFENVLSFFQIHNAFLTKILITYKSYGLDYIYTEYWCQKTEDTYTSLIFRVDGQFVLYLTDNSDLEEISSFLNLLGFKSLLYDNQYSLDISGSEQHTGVIMSLESSEQLLNHKRIGNCKDGFKYEICKESNYKRIFSFFNSLNCDDVKISDYGSFATDLNSKLRSGCGAAYSLYEYQKIHSEMVACCITLTDGSVGIIGPVATKEEYRKRDFAKSLISYTNAIGNYKKLLLFCSDDIRKEIYTKMGFMPVGKWKEIYR